MNTILLLGFLLTKTRKYIQYLNEFRLLNEIKIFLIIQEVKELLLKLKYVFIFSKEEPLLLEKELVCSKNSEHSESEKCIEMTYFHVFHS